MEGIGFESVIQANGAVIYLRVSTEEQCDNYSLNTQEEICRKEAERRNLSVFKIFREEGKSAKTIDGRPALIDMLEFCRKDKKNIDAIIVYRLDRVSRQTADYLAIRKKLAECDIKLISATEPTGNSPTEKFIETMLAGFAQMDNDVRSERTKNGMKARVLSGLNTGYVPLGYISHNGYPVKDPKTFDLIKDAWEKMTGGTITLRQMAVELNKKGIISGNPGREKHQLRAQTLNRIFRNKFYTGKIISKTYGLEIQGQHTPMITEELFYRVQAVLDGRNTQLLAPVVRRNRDNPDFPLRRIVKCGHCGKSFTGAKSKGKNQHYGYYFCPNRCPGSNVAVPVLENTTKIMLKTISLHDKTVTLLNAYIRRTYFQRISSLNKRREQSEMELKKLYEFRQALIEKNLSGVYSDEIFKEQNKVVEGKIGDLQIARDDELIKKYSLENISKFIHEKLEDLSKTYETSGIEQKRVLLCSIYPAGMHWKQNAYSNTLISKFYKGFLALQNDSVSFGTLEGLCFEHLLSWLNHLMSAFIDENDE